MASLRHVRASGVIPTTVSATRCSSGIGTVRSSSLPALLAESRFGDDITIPTQRFIIQRFDSYYRGAETWPSPQWRRVMQDSKIPTSSSKSRMDKAVDDFRKALVGTRTGRASVHMLDSVTVEAYGAQMPLNQVATVHTPEPQLITVQPFDPSQLGAIEKSIRGAELGLNPMNGWQRSSWCRFLR